MYNQYYNYGVTNYRSEVEEQVSEELISFEEAVNLIRESVADEKEDEMFYEEIIKIAPSQKEKDIIASIRDDERKHNKILRDLYYKFTGNMLPHEMPVPEVNPITSYRDGLEDALFGELEAVKKYRKIMGAMPEDESHTLLMSIMTDEIRHANKYNFLIATK